MHRAVAGIVASTLVACAPQDWPSAEPIAYDASACEPFGGIAPNPNYAGDAAVLDAPADADDVATDAVGDATTDAPSGDGEVGDGDAADSADSAETSSADSGNGGGGIPFDAGPTVARTDVDSIFSVSCSFTSCHGRKPDGVGNLYLPLRSEGDWRHYVVGVEAHEVPGMALVAPGDPVNSWLVQKIAGGNCAFTAKCLHHDCGDRMPAANDALDPSDVDTIVRWVLQGGLDTKGSTTP